MNDCGAYRIERSDIIVGGLVADGGGVNPKVGIILVNWNGLADTLDCLDSLGKSTYQNFKIVVVDNGSTENPAEMIANKYPRVDVLRNHNNEGFCRGNNIGIQHCRQGGVEYFWLLNNDCIVEPDTIERLVDAAESSPEVGIVSPVIYYFADRDKVQFGGSYIDLDSLEVHYPKVKEEAEAIFQKGPSVVLWGTALFIKRSVVDRIGLLDDRFFAYWEDIDYSLRSLKSRYRNIVCTSARVYHKRGLTLGGEEAGKSAYFYYYLERNRLLLERKYLRSAWDRVKFYMMGLANGSAHTLRCPEEWVNIMLMGVWHGLKGIAGPMKNEPNMPMYLRKICISGSILHPVFWVHALTLNIGVARDHFLRWSRNSC